MIGPSAELEVRVLEALLEPRSVGDILFLRPALKEAGRESSETAIAALSGSGLISQVAGAEKWALTDGTRWLINPEKSQIRCDRVDASTDGEFSVGGLVEWRVLKAGDWWQSGSGGSGTVLDVEAWDAASQLVTIRVSAGPLVAPLVLTRWELDPGGG